MKLNRKGITLIELLVALALGALLVGGTYRLFVSQNRAYTVQDQVVDIQQNIRGAMEILVRDLRMTGCDNDTTPGITPRGTPIIVGDHTVTTRFERGGALCVVQYWVDENSNLMRQETLGAVTTSEALLGNVNALSFAYGVDGDEDGAIDDLNGNTVVDDWVDAASAANLKIISVRVTLTAGPPQGNPNLQNISPRSLISAVTFRNL
jgi:prepilin-type N-terminal cleavage/methylation domain-containing protein